MSVQCFDLECRDCTRLANFLDEVKQDHPDYHARPVAPFGDAKARLLIVGLAPGMHGANATGRPFTGDYAGILLYETLYEFGFSNQAESTHKRDGLKLINCRITNAVKCLPPQNKPQPAEINQCNEFLACELQALKKDSVIIALGSIAHRAVIKAFKLKQSDYTFAHAQVHELNDSLTMIDSYHCSRYNTQTKRLTPAMFKKVFKLARQFLGD